ncbi:hypothetical protein ACVWWJ_004477 [Luteibacter sp. HA06]
MEAPCHQILLMAIHEGLQQKSQVMVVGIAAPAADGPAVALALLTARRMQCGELFEVVTRQPPCQFAVGEHSGNHLRKDDAFMHGLAFCAPILGKLGRTPQRNSTNTVSSEHSRRPCIGQQGIEGLGHSMKTGLRISCLILQGLSLLPPHPLSSDRVTHTTAPPSGTSKRGLSARPVRDTCSLQREARCACRSTSARLGTASVEERNSRSDQVLRRRTARRRRCVFPRPPCG